MLPSDYGAPYPSWLPNQLEGWGIIQEAYKRARERGEQQALVLASPTGAGKSLWVFLASTLTRATYLAATHSLLNQIRDTLEFEEVKGRYAYACAHPEKINAWRKERNVDQNGQLILPLASDCHYSPMKKCPFRDECGYLIAMDNALGSSRMACTPQMALFHQGIQQRGGIVVIDEVHHLPEVLSGFVEFSITEQDLHKYNLPMYPFQAGYGEPNDKGEIKGGELSASTTPEAYLKINAWLNQCIIGLEEMLALDDPLAPKIAGTQKFHDRLKRIISTLNTCTWFMATGKGIMKQRGRWVGGVMLKPITVRNLAPRLWANADLVIFMSATVGDPKPLMEELGVERFESCSFPHPIPVEARRVHDLGFERMTHTNLKTKPMLYRTQALRIARAVQTMPEHYRGLIVTSSYEKIKQLNQYLPGLLPGRIWQPPQTSIGGRLEAFVEDEGEGIIHIETIQGAGTGFDGRGDILRFVVVAGLDHPNPHDIFMQIKKKYNFHLVMGGVYLGAIQASGRAARSEHRDKMSAQELNGFHDYDFTEEGFLIAKTFLADGTAMTKMAMRYYQHCPWFVEAITKMEW